MTLNWSFASSLVHVVCAAPILLCSGCPDKESSTDSTTGGTTTGAPMTGDPPTSGETTTTGEPTTGASSDSMGEACPAGSGDLSQSCMQVCAKYDECSDVNPESCAASCEEEAFMDTQECRCAATAWADCRAGLDCEALDTAGSGPNAACFAEFAGYLITCATCYSTPEFLAASVCLVTVECPDVLGVTFLCQDGTCTCTEDETEYKTCPDPGVCGGMDAAALKAAASECCGVPF